MAVVRAYDSLGVKVATKGMKVPKRVTNIEAWFKEAAKALKSTRCFAEVQLTVADVLLITFKLPDGSRWTIARKENSLGMR